MSWIIPGSVEGLGDTSSDHHRTYLTTKRKLKTHFTEMFSKTNKWLNLILCLESDLEEVLRCVGALRFERIFAALWRKWKILVEASLLVMWLWHRTTCDNTGTKIPAEIFTFFSLHPANSISNCHRCFQRNPWFGWISVLQEGQRDNQLLVCSGGAASITINPRSQDTGRALNPGVNEENLDVKNAEGLPGNTGRISERQQGKWDGSEV